MRNVKTCAQEGLQICEPCQNVLIENVVTFGETLVGMTFSPNFVSENVTVRNFELGGDMGDSLITARCEREDAFDGFRMENVRVGNTRAIFRGARVAVENLIAECPPTEGEFTEKIPVLSHPYGRYHRYFHDEIMKSRPANSRWAEDSEN